MNKRFVTGRNTTACFVLTLIAAASGCQRATDDTQPSATAASPGTSQSAVVSTEAAHENLARAVFAGGCFWCVEAVFEELEGVADAVSGYAGGSAIDATYEAVTTGLTKHAEAVEIRYDPAKISYEKLLAVHFATHDPTTKDRQGADVGPQYRSAIFYKDDAEKQAAAAMIDRLNASNAYQGRPVVTTLEPLDVFYPAEKYHQNYVCDNPWNPYVLNVAMPKVQKVREAFKADLKKPTADEKKRPAAE